MFCICGLGLVMESSNVSTFQAVAFCLHFTSEAISKIMLRSSADLVCLGLIKTVLQFHDSRVLIHDMALRNLLIHDHWGF